MLPELLEVPILRGGEDIPSGELNSYCRDAWKTGAAFNAFVCVSSSGEHGVLHSPTESKSLILRKAAASQEPFHAAR